jgi:cyclase
MVPAKLMQGERKSSRSSGIVRGTAGFSDRASRGEGTPPTFRGLWPVLVLLVASVGVWASAGAQTNVVQTIAPDVYFHQGDHSFVYCNNGWVVFDDYVLVVDANYPAGAKIVLPKLRATTPKPIRFVIDTHFHPDHSSGNAFWSAEGAMPVAQVATREELIKSGAAAWANEAKTRPDVAASHLQLPGLVYTDTLAFDDGHHRVELHWFGVGHTHGDTLVWLPKEKILFTGDVCVNGAYNYFHDSDITGWIKVLEAAKALGAEKICPGHGPIGGPELLVDQQGYFIELQRAVQTLVAAGKTPAQVKAAVPELGAQLRKIAHIARYVPSDFWFTAHVEKVYVELGGEALPK